MKESLTPDVKFCSFTSYTVWKFQDFSITQILREINRENQEVLKMPLFANLGAPNFVNLVNFSLQNPY